MDLLNYLDAIIHTGPWNLRIGEEIISDGNDDELPSGILVGRILKQCQGLTELRCRYMYIYSVLSREKYDIGTLTAIKHYIGTGNSKLMRQPACPITFQSDETSSDLQRTRRVQTIKPPDRLDLKGN